MERVLRGLAGRAGELPMLEVETYTWSVLGSDWLPDRDLAAALGRELEFVDRVVSG